MSKEYDFSHAKRAKNVPHLKRFQEESKGKTRITIMLDNVVLDAFKAMANNESIGYQTLINRTLRQSLDKKPLDEEALRRVVREELGRYSTK